ncbi:MAG: hypothetical protein ACFFE5_15500, partial [Candidatus Thorarchaeota archaeon]
VDGSNIIIKYKCPKHGVKLIKIPLMQKNQYIPSIRKGFFKCYKCGQETSAQSAKTSGPWMLVKSACPTHGNKLPLQRIWSTIYIEISDKDTPTLQVAEPENKQITKKKLCPNCKTPINATSKYCDACGAELAKVKD